MEVMNVGLVGCGMIRTPYLRSCGLSDRLSLVACSDLQDERATGACREVKENGWGNPKVCSYEEMLKNDSVDMVINITNPSAHYRLNKMALEAGKHVYCEKPLCVTLKEANELLQIAEKNGKLLCCAPDTFLGAGHQTAREAVDRGDIGEPTTAVIFFAGGGPDGYHEDPDFFFQPGAGPMLDVGVYSLTQLITTLGPVKDVAGHSKITFPERIILSSKRCGQKMKVEVPTHVSASLLFKNSVIATFVTSFDIKAGHNLPHAEIYGTEGTISLPDPNQFNGKPRLFRADDSEKGGRELKLSRGYSGKNRGIGAVDLAAALENGRRPRASGELAAHVLEVALSIYESSDTGRHVRIQSSPQRPEPMPEGLTEDIFS